MKKAFLPFLLVANFCFGQVNLNLGLRAYYPFSGNANDVSGNNNNPVFNNATLTADRFGNPNSAYHFNGTNNYMQVPDNATLNMGNKMSIAIWVKPTGYYTGPCYNNMCVMKSNPTTVPSNYFIRFADIFNGCTSPSTTVERFAGNNVIATTPFVQLNQWYSVVWTSDGVTERIYVNCELRSSVPAGGVPYTNISDLLFGKNVDPAFPYWLDGDLDEIRLYDRALNQDEVNTLGGCIIATPCTNWLSTPSNLSYATIGDLDVSGNQITIEATYNRTQPLNGGQFPGHLVSKHSDVTDDNYSLFPNGCAITTTNGYKSTFETCGLSLNKTYHVAMVYDGSSLKFYRNGFLLSQVACTGNLILNNIPAVIAQYANAPNSTTQFLGNVNEVRIWNVARTQAQLQIYMNSSLPNPTTTPGLLAYYTFDNLLNKQGNAAWNATLNGGASINATNPNCTFVADTCMVPIACNNWLRTQVVGQSVTVGDLDVSGNQITVEGNFNCSAYPVGTGNIWEEIVSKHFGTNDDNYSLRMNLGAISTTNGFFRTPPFPSSSCDSILLNKTYHAAMVYDGNTLKFYRNGFLMSQIAATGNLILNNWLTTIGDYAAVNPAQGTNFMGYLNEIRIWNVARSQAQIQAYMNTSLPNPTTQTGLLGYYTFNNLINKQGNATYNGTLNGGATINNTNPNCTFVSDSCTVTSPCNNWLKTPTYPSTASIGNLNVTGNQITVEANYNCSSYSAGFGFGGNLIAKHTNAANTCYALSPHAAELSTSNNGYVVTTQTCPFELNKTYHAAMVYDGASLKFYRNGFLMSQVPCSGNISSNSLSAIIGNGPALPAANQFIGNINEMRIWNVARTQAQIQTFMNSSLPNPTTTPGLLAYYTFDNLLNKQGNAAWNATLTGGATINATNPNCTFVADSCAVTPPTFTIINDYTPVLALNLCTNTLTVENDTAYHAGDTVLLIQMKGAVIDSTNTAAFGNVITYKNSGNYEFNYVKSKSGNNIELKNMLTRQYDIPVGKVQLVRVPYYSNLSTSSILTCLPWDGSKGGVLAFNVQNALTLNADIDVVAKGFRGSQPITNIPSATLYNQTDYAYPANIVDGSRKGEGITEVSENLIYCRGPLSSGGGGGNSSNSGGGGGGNAGIGGRGGNEWGGSATVLTNGGVGGNKYTYSGATNKIFMGGAGGAGQANNGTGTAGGNGGGIVIITANSINPNGKKIIADGSQGVDCLNLAVCADGVGGGGAGGTVLLNAQSINSNFQIQTNGGKGADNNINGPNAHGPGGGGGGGSLLVNSSAILANIIYTTSAGLAGRAINQGNTNWGAVSGSNGTSSSGFIVPFSSVPFRKNIDSVRIKDSLLICNSFDFKGLAYTNFSPVVSWQWNFGDGGTANTQNTSHTYTATGAYSVRLIVTDINGCRDTIAKTINTVLFTADAGSDVLLCTATPGPVVLNASSGTSYSWTPTAPLNNPTLQNPTANVTATTRFYVTITNPIGCVATDSVTVTVSAAPAGIRYPEVNALVNQQIQLQARNLGGNSYLWLPPTGLTNNLIINPLFTYNQSQEFKITIKTAAGCPVVDTQFVKVAGKKGIYVPKAFSPNSNGTNDRLYPILVGIKQLNYFRIYNRWGNLIFETNSGSPAAGWDGTIKGRLQPVETYTWTVEGVDIDGILIRKSGNTLLVR